MDQVKKADDKTPDKADKPKDKPLAFGLTPGRLRDAIAESMKKQAEEHAKLLEEEPSFKEGEGVEQPLD